ncbi:MAG: methyltransferase domain-containing protein [Pseudomonadota bacterium]
MDTTGSPAETHDNASKDRARGFSCRFCAAPLRTTFVDLGMSPLCQTHTALDRLHEVEPFYLLHAYVCDQCFRVQLQEFVTPDEVFTEYAYFSSYSTNWVEHARRYAEMTIERSKLGAGSKVMEIASNDGYLLQHFVARGVPVLGIEPAANVARAAIARAVPPTVEYFGRKTAAAIAAEQGRPDVLLVNTVLAHVPDANDFVAGMKILLAPHGVNWTNTASSTVPKKSAESAAGWVTVPAGTKDREHSDSAARTPRRSTHIRSGAPLRDSAAELRGSSCRVFNTRSVNLPLPINRHRKLRIEPAGPSSKERYAAYFWYAASSPDSIRVVAERRRNKARRLVVRLARPGNLTGGGILLLLRSRLRCSRPSTASTNERAGRTSGGRFWKPGLARTARSRAASGSWMHALTLQTRGLQLVHVLDFLHSGLGRHANACLLEDEEGISSRCKLCLLCGLEPPFRAAALVLHSNRLVARPPARGHRTATKPKSASVRQPVGESWSSRFLQVRRIRT